MDFPNWTLRIPLFITYFDLCDPLKFIELGRFRRAWVWMGMVLSSSFVSQRHIYLFSIFSIICYSCRKCFAYCVQPWQHKQEEEKAPPHLTLPPTKKTNKGQG